MSVSTGRGAVLAAGIALQASLGSVYAWSFFQKPIMVAYGWSNAQTLWIFSLAIFFLGLSAAWAGTVLPRLGPGKLAIAGAVLYGTGWALGSLAMRLHNLSLFYLGFGVVGGAGLGLGYVTPVATVSKWFPGRKGLATGAVVMGFGLGALFMSKVLAPLLLRLTRGSLPDTFLFSGLVLGSVALAAAALLRNPPSAVTGSVPSGGSERPVIDGRFAVLWFMFFANIAAGIMFIGLQSPMLQDLLIRGGSPMDAAALAAAGASLVGASSLFNGLGRILWGAVSDRAGRIAAFRLILGTLALALVTLVFVRSPLLFSALVCYALLCYGGGFGAMPSAIGEIFGQERMAATYGAMLTAWSAGGIAGPQLAAAFKDRGLPPGWTFVSAIALLALGFAASFLVRWKRPA